MTRVHAMHASMQFTDKPAWQDADLKKIFTRASARKVGWITGTEANTDDFRERIKDAGEAYGYRVATRAGDSWIAVRKSFMTGGWHGFYSPVLSPTDGEGKHGPRGVLGVSFKTAEVGTITVLTAHYLLKGNPDANDPGRRVNAKFNLQLAREIGRLAKEYGKGRNLVFYGGDQNITDRTEDTFMGQPLTSAWDELKRWESTGHGTYDVIASYDHDNRVAAAYCRALDDTEFKLNTDHWLVEAGFDIRPLTSKGGRS
jgi:hypothetical protein